jgi:hypothetical protein
MKIKCRNCGIVYESAQMDFTDVEIYSRLKCGIEGTHIFIGCA